MIKFAEYEAFVAETGKPSNPNTPHEQLVHYAAFKLASEAGEVSDIFGRALKGSCATDVEVADIDPVKLALELGDVLWYVARLAALHGMTVGDIAKVNRAKLMHRKQFGKSHEDEHALARMLLAERFTAPQKIVVDPEEHTRATIDMGAVPGPRYGPTGCLIRDDGLCVAGPGRCEHTTSGPARFAFDEVRITDASCMRADQTQEIRFEAVVKPAALYPCKRCGVEAPKSELWEGTGTCKTVCYVPPPPPAAKDWINTHTGRKFRPLTPSVGDVCIDDVAHALARQCRYTGQGAFYSVAEHSVKLAVVVLDRTGDMQAARYALLHDASEAYLADVSTPVKHHHDFAFYRRAEGNLQSAIYMAFDLDLGCEPPIVRELDKVIRSTEVPQIFEHRHPDWTLEEPMPELLGLSWGWTPEEAESAFRDWFAFLFDSAEHVK